MPCTASELTMSRMTVKSVDGFRLIASGKAELIGVGAVGNGRQEHDGRPALEGRLADVAADRFGLEDVGAVGEMQVVRLGRAHRQHGDFARVLAQVSVIQSPRAPRDAR